jgi:CRP/FNR family transcriptional regulator, cyclic AMP receptor protein
MNPDPARLAALPLFETLSPKELDLVASWTDERVVSRGQSLVSEGAPGYVFFVIEDGTAAVERDGDILGELGPGDHFGEIAIVDGGKRTATVLATSDMKIFAMFGTEFRRLEAELPHVAERIHATMRDRISRDG